MTRLAVFASALLAALLIAAVSRGAMVVEPAAQSPPATGSVPVDAAGPRAAPAAAADLTPIDVPDQSPPLISVFPKDESLSDEVWNAIGFDRDGFVWAGLASSLARFDGYRWNRWPLPGLASLVRDFATDDSGVLWALFEAEGLARYDGVSWQLRDDIPGSTNRFSVTRGAEGRRELWVSQNEGLWHLEKDRWKADPGNDLVRIGRTVAIAQTQTLFAAPRQWLATTQTGLWYREVRSPAPPGPWIHFENPEFDRLPYTDLVQSVDAGEEELWLLTYGNGIARIRNDGVRWWRSANGALPTEAMYTGVVTQSAEGRRILWVSSRAGLLRIRGDDVTVLDRRHGLPADAVRGLKLRLGPDGIDRLWMATESGAARIVMAESRWRTVSLLGARENGVFAVLVEPDGHGGERLWVGTTKEGVGMLQDGQWRYFTQPDGTLPAAGVRGIWRVPGPDGKIWRLMGLSRGTVLRIDDALGFSELAVPWNPHDAEAVSFVLPRRFEGQDELWFATFRSGIYRLRGSEWTRFPSAGIPANWRVTSLAKQIDAKGKSWIWSSSNHGLERFDGERWQRVADVPGMPADAVLSMIFLERAGRTEMWASSSRNGIVRLDVTDPAKPRAIADSRIPEPPDPTVYGVLPDSVGRLYVCTNNGVQQLTPTASGGYNQRVYRRRDGLVHDECNTNAQFIDAHDRYWVGTLGGLSVFDPRRTTAAGTREAHKLRLTAVGVDGDRVPAHWGGRVEIPAGTRDLRVEYSLLTDRRETESTYRTRMVGLDDEPGPWTAEHSRVFSVLPPGRYAFEVTARDHLGTRTQSRSLEFHVQPHWWQRTSIRALVIFALVLAALGLVQLYNRGLRLRQRRLRIEVAMRTEELNVANQQLTELSYRDPLTGLANRRRLMESLEAEIERAAARDMPIGLVVVDVDRFKDYNDQFGHVAGDTALRAVAQALAAATRGQDLVARFGGEEFACLLVDADLGVTHRVAERMRTLVEALPPRALGNDTVGLTVSAGLLSRVPQPGELTVALLHEADAALYRAKREGRNRVCIADAQDDGSLG